MCLKSEMDPCVRETRPPSPFCSPLRSFGVSGTRGNKNTSVHDLTCVNNTPNYAGESSGNTELARTHTNESKLSAVRTAPKQIFARLHSFCGQFPQLGLRNFYLRHTSVESPPQRGVVIQLALRAPH